MGMWGEEVSIGTISSVVGRVRRSDEGGGHMIVKCGSGVVGLCGFYCDGDAGEGIEL